MCTARRRSTLGCRCRAKLGQHACAEAGLARPVGFRRQLVSACSAAPQAAFGAGCAVLETALLALQVCVGVQDWLQV